MEHLILNFFWFDFVVFESFEPFFGCRKGDYYRYLAEFKSGDEKKEAAEQSLKAYEVYFSFPLFSCSKIENFHSEVETSILGFLFWGNSE